MYGNYPVSLLVGSARSSFCIKVQSSRCVRLSCSKVICYSCWPMGCVLLSPPVSVDGPVKVPRVRPSVKTTPLQIIFFVLFINLSWASSKYIEKKKLQCQIMQLHWAQKTPLVVESLQTPVDRWSVGTGPLPEIWIIERYVLMFECSRRWISKQRTPPSAENKLDSNGCKIIFESREQLKNHLTYCLFILAKKSTRLFT